MRRVWWVCVLLASGCLEAPADDARPEPASVGLEAGAIPRAAGYASAEPHVAANPRAANLVVAASMEYHRGAGTTQDQRFEIAIHRSADGGRNWTSARLPAEVRRPFDAADAFNYHGDPVLAYAPDGRLYLVAIAAHGAWKEGGAADAVQLSGLTLFVTRSADDGVTWSSAIYYRQSVGTFGFPILFAGTLHDKPWIAVGPDGAIHVTWTEFVQGLSMLHYTRSVDGGTTWSEPRTLTMSQPGLASAPAPAKSEQPVQGSVVAAGQRNHVYVMATQYAPITSSQLPQDGRILVWRSEDNGATFSEPVPVGPGTFPRFAQISIDPDDPWHVVVATPDDSAAAKLYLSTSHDAGRTWTPPAFVAPNRSKDQLNPVVSVQGPEIVVGYYDLGWDAAEHFVIAVFQNSTKTFEKAAGDAIAPGSFRHEYTGMARVGEDFLAVFVAGNASNGTFVGTARLTRDA